jgi:hypothetical protein
MVQLAVVTLHPFVSDLVEIHDHDFLSPDGFSPNFSPSDAAWGM